MARCEEGYRCLVCGREVEELTASELYLRYVIGELDPELLHVTPEKHLQCSPLIAQFIDHPQFPKIVGEGEWGIDQLDQAFVRERTELVTRGYARLVELQRLGGDRDVTEYPLPEAIAVYRRNDSSSTDR